MNVVSDNGRTEELLQRFLDGELDEERYLEAKELIDRDGDARHRFDQLKQVNELVAGYNRSVLSEPVPAHFGLQGRRRFPVDFYRMVAGVLLVGIGVLLGWALNSAIDRPGEDGRLVNLAVSAHDLYARELRHPVEVDGSNQSDLGHWLSGRLGDEVAIPDLRRFDYALLGGRLLPGNDGSAHAMLVYEKPDGSRVSVYIMRSRQAGHTDTLYTRQSGMDVFYWRDTGLSCAVVAAAGFDADLDALRALSDSVYRQIES